MQTQTVTREEVLTTIAALPADKLAEVYDFVRFITARGVVITDAEPTDEELAAEDAKWDAALAQTTPEQWAKLHERITADIEAGNTLPMFDDNGRWLVDDQIANDLATGTRAK